MGGPRLRWLGFALAAHVPGDTGDHVGIPAAVEPWVGLEILGAGQEFGGLYGATLRALTILGGGLSGWSLGLSLGF